MKKYKFKTTFTFDGKRYQIYADTQKELYRKAERKKLELEQGKIELAGNMTLAQWIEKCISTYKTNQKEITNKKYRARIKHCITDHIGKYPLRSIKPLQLQECMNLQIGKSKTQINEVYNAIKFFFEKAIDNQLISVNPSKSLIKPLGYTNHRRALTEKEQIHLLKVAITDRRYYLFLLMFYCGCRPAEAAECQGRDIIKRDGIYLLHIRGTKTINSDRLVPLPTVFFNLVKDTPAFDYIACYNNGNKINAANRNRVWKSLKRQINIDMGCKVYRNQLVPPFPLSTEIVPYCIRHTYCTNLARKGIDIRIAQKLMGHSDISLTANIYTHVDIIDVVKIAHSIDSNVLTGGLPEPQKLVK